MWTYNYTPSSDDIMHYGILGMRWGHRKAIIPSVSQVSTNRAVNKAIDAKAKMQSAKKAYKTANKKFDKAYRKQYMAGESFIGKMYGKASGSDRTYADLQYEFNRNHK